MRFPVLLLAAAATLSAADLRIDHVTISGSDLAAMRKAFTAVTRIEPEYGGPHSNHATEMALVAFPDGSYLELMGIQPHPDAAQIAAHVWSKFLRENAGPCAFAIRVPDVTLEVARLRVAGVATGVAERSGRTRPDGVKLDWETANIGPGARGSLFPFLIRDFTPRENRVYPAGKPTTAEFAGVSKVVIGVHDLSAAIAQYRTAFGLPLPKRQRDPAFGADLAWFEGTPIVLAQSDKTDSWLAWRVAEYGDAPCAFILAGSGQLVQTRAAQWFGREVRWINEAALGWRLGVEAATTAR